MIKKMLLGSAVVLTAMGMLSCSLQAEKKLSLPIKEELNGYKLKIEGKNSSFRYSVSQKTISDKLEILTLAMSSPEASKPEKIKISWSLPSQNVAGVWKNNSYLSKTIKPDWYPSKVKSMLAKNAPAIQLFSNSDDNILTFAVSDALNTVKSSAGVREEDGRIYCSVELFTEPHKELKDYRIQILLDRRHLPYYSSLKYIADWWAALDGFRPAPVPEIARTPMYSTWYSYHQNLDHDALLEEVKVSASMGFKAIIVDDGWQTMDSNRGYAYTGDWKPERLTKMRELVSSIHKEGLKFILWYGVPLVGEKSEVFSKFKGKYLRQWKGQGAWELDPRYPEVREHIIDTYKKAIMEWGVDGFKLDFLARFIANKNTVLTKENGRDYASVNRATDRLMTDIMSELRKVKEDIMIEFRQPYIGPLMRKYGNMFRVGDCPNSAVVNRVGSVDLRLLSGNTAVHSDMIMWNYKEPVEAAALQFLNIIFSVPQISVRLKDIPEDHFRMVKYITEYWNRNKATLLDGDFKPGKPLGNYPVITASSKNKSIYALYDSIMITPESDNFDVINARTDGEVYVRADRNSGNYEYKVFNCMGDLKKEGKLELSKGIHTIQVPPSGIVEFNKIK